MEEKAKEKAQAERIRGMVFGEVYVLYVRKAERKGRSREEVDAIIRWLTGYEEKALKALVEGGIDFGRFFAEAPRYNPQAVKVTGLVCGVRVEEIEDVFLRQVRCLDKLVDELAKGKAMDKILRS